MDMTELRAQHPGLYDRIYAKGVDDERRRCADHIELAESAGAPALARKSIEDGLTLSEAVPTYRKAAGHSDETAARFMRKVEALAPARMGTAQKAKSSLMQDAADIVASIVTGNHSGDALLSIQRREDARTAPQPSRDGRAPADIVADFVCGKEAQ